MGDLLRVMKKKGENLEISFTETKQRLQKNAIRARTALPYKNIYMKVAERERFGGYQQNIFQRMATITPDIT